MFVYLYCNTVNFYLKPNNSYRSDKGKLIETEENTYIDLNNTLSSTSIALISGYVIIAAFRDVNNGCFISGYLLNSNETLTVPTNISCVDSSRLIGAISSGNNNTALI